ncbi:hypothetical protein GLAREA_04404 [Glarea lozoyensis ATCC 20868]|uniref:Uncharacterized protein n=1 Tax=Glarea lozoyensis (strain ATCC 20868 / MF5171) TaxID=1116229 RepID=S3DM62_GLAL2|nr:uncharacterized protein GLAREA_04404 [Glarea lozoyensis ATCC 20868]EPE27613.1 hypothetical protein GLAREA_04404 [Glarea lozoyensis ATCC 20868]
MTLTFVEQKTDKRVPKETGKKSEHCTSPFYGLLGQSALMIHEANFAELVVSAVWLAEGSLADVKAKRFAAKVALCSTSISRQRTSFPVTYTATS